MKPYFKPIALAAAIVLSNLPSTSVESHAVDRVGDRVADSTLMRLKSLDERVWTIGHRLLVGASALCQGAYAPGFTIQSATQYAPAFRATAASVLGAGARPSAGIVVAGAGAERAGLRRGDIVTAIDSHPVVAPADAAKATFADVERLESVVDRESQDGALVLDVIRDGAARRLTITPDRGCPTRFDVRVGGATDASANGRYVQVGSDLVRSLPSDDDLAAVLAHEIAHNVLGHAKVLDSVRGGLLAGFGRSGRTIRATEGAADRLSLYILVQSGYRTEPAIAFWDRFTRANDWGIFSDRTHPGPAERVRVLTAEATRIAGLRAANAAVAPPDDLVRSTGTSDPPPPGR